MSEILDLIGAACRAAGERRFEEAARLAAGVLERWPTCLRALRVLAWAQLELDQQQALETFERCAAHDPEDALASVGQAIWLQTHQQDAAAIPHWVRAWELDPLSQAIRRSLVRLTGELPESAFAEAITLLRTGGAAEAADLLRGLNKHTDDAGVALSLMDALWTIGEQRDAFDVAVAVHARHPLAVTAALYVAAMEDAAGRILRRRETLAWVEQVDPGLRLFSDVVRRLGLQPALDLTRASRPPVAEAR